MKTRRGSIVPQRVLRKVMKERSRSNAKHVQKSFGSKGLQRRNIAIRRVQEKLNLWDLSGVTLEVDLGGEKT